MPAMAFPLCGSRSGLVPPGKDFMKYIIGCLALVGLVIILAVGGCLGMIGYGIAAIPKIPDYVSRIAIEKQYAKDLKLIDQGIRSGKLDALAKEVSSDIVAIYMDHKDVLKKVKFTSDSYHISNGIGVGELQANTENFQCVVYEMTNGDATYAIFIVDHGPPGGPARSPAK
jgi:hypothetical protein